MTAGAGEVAAEAGQGVASGPRKGDTTGLGVWLTLGEGDSEPETLAGGVGVAARPGPAREGEGNRGADREGRTACHRPG